jgi:hypothetical protein
LAVFMRHFSHFNTFRGSPELRKMPMCVGKKKAFRLSWRMIACHKNRSFLKLHQEFLRLLGLFLVILF